VAFYASLGFGGIATYPDEYLIIRHPSGIELHFFHQPGLRPASNDHGAYIRLDDPGSLLALFDHWASAAPANIARQPEETDYGLIEFALLDAHGNLLRVGAPREVD
jgi:hypothetical protein